MRGYTDDHRRRDSSWFNYPKVVTVENAPRVYRAAEQMMVWMNMGMVIVIGSVVVGIVKIFRA